MRTVRAILHGMSSGKLSFVLRHARTALVAGSMVGTLGSMTAIACSSNTLPNPRVYLSAFLVPGTNPPVGCGIVPTAGGWVIIGDPTQSVNNGDSQGGSAVSVSCTVSSSGDGSFSVNSSATLEGLNGGSVTITGTFLPSGKSTNIRGHFQRGDTGSFDEVDCTADYSANPSSMGVASGRVWATLTCPMVTKTDTTPARVCQGTAEFRFENCSQ